MINNYVVNDNFNVGTLRTRDLRVPLEVGCEFNLGSSQLLIFQTNILDYCVINNECLIQFIYFF